MKSNKLIKNKKGQGNILISVFFIVLVLIMVFLFTQYHKVILISNYNLNDEKIKNKVLYSLKEELISCYGYPLKITSLQDCQSLSNINFKIEIRDNFLCSQEVLLSSGIESVSQLNLFVPIENSNSNVCPANIYLYFIDE